jgi:lipoprotein-releasing system ATP-binding protein
MTKTFVLSAKNIRKEFYRPEKILILNDISLNVGPSETIAIVGPSGSGKSTLLQILGTLESPTSGSLYFYGDKIEKNRLSEIRNKRCGFIFQASNLLEEYSLLDNLLLKAKIARRPTHKGSEAYNEALSLIDQVGLSHRIQFPLKYLSGGEKQRAAIARAFVNNPELILADEPTGNLDTTSAHGIMELLISSCKNNNKSLIVVTHDTTFANLVDTKLHLDAGLLYER